MIYEIKNKQYDMNHYITFIGQNINYNIFSITEYNKIYIEISSEEDYPMKSIEFKSPIRIIARNIDITMVELLPFTNSNFLKKGTIYEISAPFNFKLVDVAYTERVNNKKYDHIKLSLKIYEEYVINDPVMFTNANQREHLYRSYWTIDGWVTEYIDNPTEEDYDNYGQYTKGWFGEEPIISEDIIIKTDSGCC